jgi:1-pyrroline-5-carboxylate dehydrogenase
VDTTIAIGRFAQATAADVDAGVQAARGAARGWASTPWQERADILDRAASLISERRSELAGVMAIEVGKTRLEALGDVEESADLIRYYTHQLRDHRGFDQPMERLKPDEGTFDVLRPYGVWAVIGPFNYPMALIAGPAGAALAAGNTVVAKPSNAGALCGLLVVELLREAGVPDGAVHCVFGGAETGRALVAHPRVDGVTFTGSVTTGMEIYRSFALAHPKPMVCEMGGKNPVVVTANADLDLAAEGTARSAFGLAGQKCSAASRAYVDASVFDEFVERLVAHADQLVVGDPLERATFVGPVIDERAVERYEQVVSDIGRAGKVVTGGRRVTEGDLARGHYLAPTVATVPYDHVVWTRELFVPLIAVGPVANLDEALARANGTTFGLTAGMFSEDDAEVDRFLDEIEAGVVYVNRRGGATTGAWPGAQPFGGWKASGTNGKAGGGPYYLQQYLREQSRTIVGR